MLHVHYISSASPKLELYHQVWLDVHAKDFLTEKSGNPVILNRYLWYYTMIQSIHINTYKECIPACQDMKKKNGSRTIK